VTLPTSASRSGSPQLALVHAMADVVQGHLDEAAADLVVAETYVETAPPDRRRHLQVAMRRAKRRGRRYHLEAGQALTWLALAHGYDTAMWWIAGIFAGRAVIGGALLRRGPLVQSAHRPRQTTG
jgi:hypothetical protein